MSKSRKCFIGVGSPHGDDQIGWLIADEVKMRFGNEMRVHQVYSPLEILDNLEDVDWLGLCDGCRGLGTLGEWKRWNWPALHSVDSSFAGSHDFGLVATLQLARQLERLPASVVIWGIEIGLVDPMSVVSSEVRLSIPRLIDAIQEELELIH